MLHTIKANDEGVVPTGHWAPIVRYPMLRGFSAAAWQRFSSMSLLTVMVTMIPIVGFALASGKETWARNFFVVFAGIFGLAGLATGVSAAVSTYKARKEYRHGYTTLQSFAKYGLYYWTLPQLDPRSGVEVRAAREPKLALPELTKRLAAARAQHVRPERMSRQDAAAAAAKAKETDQMNQEEAKAKSNRAQLINRFGTAAGNMRADARNYYSAAILIACVGIPAVIFGIEGTTIARNPLWLLPAIVLTLVVTVLALIGRRKTARATRLAAEFLGVATKDLPPWTTFSAPGTRQSAPKAPTG